jgi:hypothetical protein
VSSTTRRNWGWRVAREEAVEVFKVVVGKWREAGSRFLRGRRKKQTKPDAFETQQRAICTVRTVRAVAAAWQPQCCDRDARVRSSRTRPLWGSQARPGEASRGAHVFTVGSPNLENHF